MRSIKRPYVHRRSSYFVPIKYERPRNACVSSHRLLIEAGYLRKVSSGLYNYLPMFLRVLEKLIKIIDEEMQNIGGQKMLISKISPKSLWDVTNRWDIIGDELFRLKDRKGGSFCLTPTCEEIIASISSTDIFSAKQFPIKLYQIGEKYRDEKRPRSGLIRSREFIMKDMYSLDSTRDGAIRSYNEVMESYHRIVKKLEIPYAVVEADGGIMGDEVSHEFHAITDVGEDTLLYCLCGKHYWVPEKARGRKPRFSSSPSYIPMDVDSLLEYSLRPESCIKIFVFMDPVPALVIFDSKRKISESRVSAIFNASGQYSLEPLTNPLKMRFKELKIEKKRIVLDSSLQIDEFLPAKELNWISSLHKVLSNESPLFFTVSDVTLTQKGDICPGFDGTLQCSGAKELEECRGVEIGHLFYLGKKYSLPLKSNYMSSSQELTPIEMCSYGIGVSRVLSVVAEIHHDENGLKWPFRLAPFQVTVAAVNGFEKAAEELIEHLQEKAGIPPGEIMLDDRNESIGLKIRESNFIGIPYTIIVGKEQTDKNIIEIEDYRGEKFFMTLQKFKELFIRLNSDQTNFYEESSNK